MSVSLSDFRFAEQWDETNLLWLNERLKYLEVVVKFPDGSTVEVDPDHLIATVKDDQLVLTCKRPDRPWWEPNTKQQGSDEADIPVTLTVIP